MVALFSSFSQLLFAAKIRKYKDDEKKREIAKQATINNTIKF
jgi:hypothetical protein